MPEKSIGNCNNRLRRGMREVWDAGCAGKSGYHAFERSFYYSGQNNDTGARPDDQSRRGGKLKLERDQAGE